MKVHTVYDNPTVVVTHEDDLADLEFVAHFLGIVTHHNDNVAAPSIAAIEVIAEVKDL